MSGLVARGEPRAGLGAGALTSRRAGAKEAFEIRRGRSRRSLEGFGLKKRVLLAAIAASALTAGHAQAAVIYSQNFEGGLNANELVGGDFGVSGGTVGHQSYYYPSNDYSYYQVRLDLTQATDAMLRFNFKIHSESSWDALGLTWATNRVFSAANALNPTVPELYGTLQGSARELLGPRGLYGMSEGVATFDISHLVGQVVDIRFHFASDGGVTGLGVDLDNISVTGNLASAVPEPATWAMMITGFGLAGGAIRSRRRMAAVAA